jgi:hypothetical protein
MRIEIGQEYFEPLVLATAATFNAAVSQVPCDNFPSYINQLVAIGLVAMSLPIYRSARKPRMQRD